MDKDLKKLSRRKLLELLVEASEKNERLIAENAELRGEVSRRSRLPQATKVGSIAEAALQVNGYFDSAQRAADDYLREVKRLHDRLAANAAASEQAQQQLRDRQEELDAQARQQARAQEQLYRMNAQVQAQAQQLRQERERLEAQAREQLDAGLRQTAPAQQQTASAQQPAAESSLQDRLPQISGQGQAADAALADARLQAQSILRQAQAQAQAMLAEAHAQSQAMVSQAQAQSAAIAAEATRRSRSTLQPIRMTSDSSATGPLNRRGRHVKLAEGAMA